MYCFVLSWHQNNNSLSSFHCFVGTLIFGNFPIQVKVRKYDKSCQIQRSAGWHRVRETAPMATAKNHLWSHCDPNLSIRCSCWRMFRWERPMATSWLTLGNQETKAFSSVEFKMMWRTRASSSLKHDWASTGQEASPQMRSWIHKWYQINDEKIGIFFEGWLAIPLTSQKNYWAGAKNKKEKPFILHLETNLGADQALLQPFQVHVGDGKSCRTVPRLR